MNQGFECQYCRSKFRHLTTFSSHLCVKKQRVNDLDTAAGPRLGFRVFQRFYELTMNSKKLKSQQDFIDSDFYIEFVKFGNYLVLLKPVYIEQFIDFVITNGVKLKDWSKDEVYDLYIENLVKKEPSVSATERTITEIIDWCNEYNVNFTEFFLKIPVDEASHFIRMGKISPWVLYLCGTGEKLLNRFNKDHAKIIGNIIDPCIWMRKFKKEPDEVEYIRNLLEQTGI